MKVLNEYPGSHYYWEEYELTDFHCPHCGKKNVWYEQGPGDYYCGSDYICTSCGSDWTMQGPSISDNPNMKSKIQQLISQNTNEPTTRLGN